jgi:hypothetical protein
MPLFGPPKLPCSTAFQRVFHTTKTPKQTLAALAGVKKVAYPLTESHRYDILAESDQHRWHSTPTWGKA